MNAEARLARFDARTIDGLRRVRPLCRGYAVVVFCSTRAPICGIARSGELQWALGLLRNGELETLSVWDRAHDLSAAVPPGVLLEMHDRGLEFVGAGVGVDLVSSGQPLRSAFRCAHVFDSIEHAMESCAAQVPPRHRQAYVEAMRRSADAVDSHSAFEVIDRFQGSSVGEIYPDEVQLWKDALARFEPIYDLNEQLRGLVRLADRTAAEVRGRLARAILRNGPFTDSAAALDFVALALAREEQRLDRDRATAAASLQARSTTPRAVSMAGALGVPTLA